MSKENLAISQLPFVATAQAGDVLPIDQNGVTSQVRADQVAALAPNTGTTQIISSALSAGNPAFFAAGITSPVINLNILGATTPLVYFINGTKQVLNSDVPIQLVSTGGRLRFIFARKTSNPNVSQVDFFNTSNAPFWAYVQPTAPAGTSTTNPSYWFDMATGATWKATASGGAWSIVTDSIFLGVALFNAGGTALEAVLCEPFRLDHAKRLSLFGDGSTGTVAVTGTTTVQGTVQYRGLFVSGSGAKITKGAGNVGFTLIISQTPLIVTNTGQIGQAGDSGNGPAGTAISANGTAGTIGGVAGNGGGGGGAAATRTGGAGGSQTVPGSFALAAANGGGGAGGIGSNGGNAVAVTLTFYDKTLTGLFLFNRIGASGGSGGGNATGTSGAGGNGGYPVCVIAPAILVDTDCSVIADGGAGGAGTGTASGAGGGGGGSVAILAGGYTVLNGTLTAAAGAGGTGVGGGGNGGNGGAGNTSRIKLW